MPSRWDRVAGRGLVDGVMSEVLQAPFPYPGGKSTVASIIWSRFGRVSVYSEAFTGSAAVALANPGPEALRIETLNDIDCMICNFWRAVKHDPETVIDLAKNIRSEIDLIARNNALVDARESLAAACRADPDYFDARLAGWWVFCAAEWVGRGLAKEKPSRKRPNVKPMGTTALWRRGTLDETIIAIHRRLQRTTVCCGDWSRCVTPAALSCCSTEGHTIAGVFLDPPYSHSVGRDSTIYAHEMSCTAAVGDWCREFGDDPRYRICLAGYEGEYDLPGWDVVAWTASGGMAKTGNGRGMENRTRERLWFSPHCLTGDDGGLFGGRNDD